jgi:hypothetical protein
MLETPARVFVYSLRRATGNNINNKSALDRVLLLLRAHLDNPLGALDPVERNQTMGHLGSTYK